MPEAQFQILMYLMIFYVLGGKNLPAEPNHVQVDFTVKVFLPQQRILSGGKLFLFNWVLIDKESSSVLIYFESRRNVNIQDSTMGQSHNTFLV
jgi:hypothetical protein